MLGGTLLLVLLLAVVGVLVAGIFVMVRGGEANRTYGNRIMVARVALQGVALAVAVALLVLKQ